MKLTLRRDIAGYATPTLEKSGINGLAIDKPFVLFTGPNGSGKSAAMRAMRATIGLRGERYGKLDTPMRHQLDPATTSDPARLAAEVRGIGDTTEVADHVPSVFDLGDLEWKGQESHFFDSRTTSGMANSSSLADDDMLHHISMIAGGGAKVSHGQFVSRAWWEAIRWAAGLTETRSVWDHGVNSAKQAMRDGALQGAEPSIERWLFIDEPETAIDTEALLLGMASLLKTAETGTLRVFCASHSLLFAAGLMLHPKVQVVDMAGGGDWVSTQRIALQIAGDVEKIDAIGADILGKMSAPKRERPRRR